MNNNKRNLIVFIVLIVISLGLLGVSYNQKIKKENLLTTQLEEIQNTYKDINISNMNEAEENSFKDLDNKFNESINLRNLEKSQAVLDDMLKLEDSVNKRLEDEKIESEKKAEEEKAKLEEEKKKEELAFHEEESKKSSDGQSSTTDNSNKTIANVGSTMPKIANTSVATSSNQLISVVSTGGSTAELILWQKDSNGTWYEYDSMFARLGENGMKSASEVYEMDLCTPTGVYTLSEAFGVANDPGSNVGYRVLDGSEYWVDDVDSPYYNTMQFGAPTGRWKSAEHLTEYQNAYKYALVIDYNRWPVVPGKSSAIFLHVDVGIPTYGCVAVASNKMVEILNWVNPSSNPKIMLSLSYDELYSY